MCAIAKIASVPENPPAGHGAGCCAARSAGNGASTRAGVTSGAFRTVGLSRGQRWVGMKDGGAQASVATGLDLGNPSLPPRGRERAARTARTSGTP